MTRQWIRKTRLTVNTGSEVIDVSALRIRFDVRQNDLQKPNTASVIITNPHPDTAKKIKKEGQSFSIEVGYEEGYGLIFKGEIIQKRIGRDNPVETYLNLLAQSGDKAYNFTTVSKTLSAGSTFRDQVDVVAEEMKKNGVEIGYIADLGTAKVARGRTLFGMGRDVLRDICTATGCSWSIQNQKLYIVKSSETLPGEVHVINSRTGMIGLPVQTFDGIVVRMLVNAKIIPGSRLKIDQASIQEQEFNPNYTAAVQNAMIPSLAEDGLYKALIVNHYGDTHGQAYYTEVTCTRADGQGPQPLSLANRGIDLSPGN